MSDDVDLAQRFEQLRRDRALGVVLADARVLQAPASGWACVACGEEIEAERRQAAPGAKRCVECQAALERRRKLFPGGVA
jgi:phage/conjugal plasmid C-4 type zinc finger TraR family protein